MSFKLTPEEMDELELIATVDSVKGDKYDGSMFTYKNSETHPPPHPPHPRKLHEGMMPIKTIYS